MRVFIVTQNEPIYAPVYLEKIVQLCSQTIIGISVLSPAGKKGWFQLVKQRLAMYGMIDFIRATLLYGYCRIRDLIPRLDGQRFYSVEKLAAQYSIPVYPCQNVNEMGYVEMLKKADIDILVSIAANQRFGKNLLQVPKLASLNIHSSLLPKYRGLDGLFWALAHNESEVGVTVHLINPKFDDGAIVEQQAFPVEDDDTLHRLYYKAIDVGAQLLVQALKNFETNRVSPIPNDIGSGSYFSWPDRASARKFRKNGRRFF